jgi:hypothetical protein
LGWFVEEKPAHDAGFFSPVEVAPDAPFHHFERGGTRFLDLDAGAQTAL